MKNIAEITKDLDENKKEIDDIDSRTNSVNPDNYSSENNEDDDDEANLKIVEKTFDLSLQKFVTKINDAAPKKDRTPKVDVTNLKNGTSTDAKYTTVKDSLAVKEGDIITYTIRVYNEGQKSGYAEQVVDYLPEGLGFLVQHKTNIDNYWEIEAGNTIKLSEIENGIANAKLEDFKDIKNLSEADVIVGKTKVTSTKLK